MSVSYMPPISNDNGNVYSGGGGMMLPRQIVPGFQTSFSPDELMLLRDKIEERQRKRTVLKYCSMGGLIAGMATCAGQWYYKLFAGPKWYHKAITLLTVLMGAMAGEFVGNVINTDTDKITGKGIAKGIGSVLGLTCGYAAMKDIIQNLGNKSKLNKTVIVAYEVIQALVLGSIGHTLGGFLGSLFDDK